MRTKKLFREDVLDVLFVDTVTDHALHMVGLGFTIAEVEAALDIARMHLRAEAHS